MKKPQKNLVSSIFHGHTFAMHRTVTLTNETGDSIGEMEIVQAHTAPGHLHRAFSVFLFSSDGSSLLLQKRSGQKMLWPGMWANTCCSHPFPNEDALAAGQRRLKEELGISASLKIGPSFIYHAEDPNGYGVEYERDVILLGTVSQDITVTPNPEEVAEWQWVPVDDLLQAMKDQPNNYAPWLHIGLPLALAA